MSVMRFFFIKFFQGSNYPPSRKWHKTNQQTNRHSDKGKTIADRPNEGVRD